MIAPSLKSPKMQKGPPLAWKFIQPTVGLFSKVLVKRLFSAVLSKIKDGYSDTHCIRITVLSWSEWRDLNPRPLGPEPSALPTALHPDVPRRAMLPQQTSLLYVLPR